AGLGQYVLPQLPDSGGGEVFRDDVADEGVEPLVDGGERRVFGARRRRLEDGDPGVRDAPGHGPPLDAERRDEEQLATPELDVGEVVGGGVDDGVDLLLYRGDPRLCRGLPGLPFVAIERLVLVP